VICQGGTGTKVNEGEGWEMRWWWVGGGTARSLMTVEGGVRRGGEVEKRLG
jgi:hypothetical protein